MGNKPGLVWKTRTCPWCGTQRRVWYRANQRAMKAVLCGDCTRFFWTDREGCVARDMFGELMVDSRG